MSLAVRSSKSELNCKHEAELLLNILFLWRELRVICHCRPWLNELVGAPGEPTCDLACIIVYAQNIEPTVVD